MATPILLLNTKVEMQSALGTPKTITGISKVSEAVVTGTHDFSVGDLILLASIGGMTEMNDRVVRVKSVSTTVSFVAEAIDSTAFTTYTSGGTATKLTTFVTFDNATSFNFGEPAPNKLDSTTIHEKISKKEIFGLDSAPEITMALQSDPMGATMVALRAAAAAKTYRGFRVTLQSGVVLIMNSYVAGGRGLSGSAGAIATATATLTLASPEQYFAS